MTHDPGGSVYLPVSDVIAAWARFDGPNDQYRTELGRCWDPDLPVVLFVQMNPSTADAKHNDPTVAKNERYARRWGYGTLLVGNAFAYRATDQKALLRVADPVGPTNDAQLLDMARRADLIVMAYGTPHPSLQWRGPVVAKMLREITQLHILKLSKFGVPYHPLYIRGDLRPVAWAV